MSCSIVLLVPECLSLSWTLHNHFYRLHFLLVNIVHIVRDFAQSAICFMKNTCCLFQIKFITEYTNVQHIIITQI
jgi:hypothetical protein